MRIKHSFYILDIDCLISLKALLYYLAEKVQVGHMCLFCNKNFSSGQASQNHMLDACHCCMNSDHFDDEYEYFYDFSGTYEDNFVGKTIEDFDLSEEPLAKLMSTEVVNYTPKEDEETKQDQNLEQVDEHMEDNDDDDDWEDIEDEVDQQNDESVTGSFQKISAPSSSTFTLIEKPESSTAQNKEESKYDYVMDEAKSMASRTGLSEHEAAQLIGMLFSSNFAIYLIHFLYNQ